MFPKLSRELKKLLLVVLSKSNSVPKVLRNKNLKRVLELHYWLIAN